MPAMMDTIKEMNMSNNVYTPFLLPVWGSNNFIILSMYTIIHKEDIFVNVMTSIFAKKDT